MTQRIAELDGVSPAAPWDHGAVSTGAAVLAADLGQPARVTTLDRLEWRARQELSARMP